MSLDGKYYFSVTDTDFPVIEAGFEDEKGNQVELIDGLAPDVKELVTEWPSSTDPPDLPSALGGNLIVNERARKAWSLISGPSVELVPLRLLGPDGRNFEGYWWAEIRHEAEIMDREASIIRESGPVILWVDNFIIDKEAIPEFDLFICSENSEVVFRDSHVRKAREAGLTGMSFVDIDGCKWPI